MRNVFLSTGYLPELVGQVCSLIQLYQTPSGLGIRYVVHSADWGKLLSFGTSCINLVLSVCWRASPSEQKNKANASLIHWKREVPLAPFVHLCCSSITTGRVWPKNGRVQPGGLDPDLELSRCFLCVVTAASLCLGRIQGFKDGVVNTLISPKRIQTSCRPD